MRSTFLINEIHKKHLLNFISNIFCNLTRAYSWWGEVRAQSVKLQKLATASLKSWLPSSTLCVTQVLLSDNLGQNKMEQQTPIPPQIKDEAARRAKTRHFPILDLRGRGGLGFPFILSKIVALKTFLWNSGNWWRTNRSLGDLQRTSNYIVQTRRASEGYTHKTSTLRINGYEHVGGRRESGLSIPYDNSGESPPRLN